MDETQAAIDEDDGDGWAMGLRAQLSSTFAKPVLRLISAGLLALAAGALIGTVLWLVVDPIPQRVALATTKAPEAGNAVAIEIQDSPAPPPDTPDWLSEPKGAPILTVPAPAPVEQDQIAELIVREETLLYEEPAVLAGTALPLAAKPSDLEIDAALAAFDFSDIARTNETAAGTPPWRRNAVAVAPGGDGPAIALVIDDLGLNRPNSRRTIALPGPLTLAFMTYAEELPDFAAATRAAGHELLVHVPMAPRDPSYDPGPNVLGTDLDPKELLRRLTWGLSRFEGYVGINNHMGSGFTTSLPGMMQVMAVLKARGLLYLDSVTAPASVGGDLAARLGVPYARRDVFIDNDPKDRAAIRRQLVALERVAARNGSAIGIGHPHNATLEELARWIPEVQKRGFRLVPVSALMRTGGGLAVSPEAPPQPG
jgi:polysaccharide deacetylase 2 family uncharacterized protein YibQ